VGRWVELCIEAIFLERAQRGSQEEHSVRTLAGFHLAAPEKCVISLFISSPVSPRWMVNSQSTCLSFSVSL
jgi:hypothetical protein